MGMRVMQMATGATDQRFHWKPSWCNGNFMRIDTISVEMKMVETLVEDAKP